MLDQSCAAGSLVQFIGTTHLPGHAHNCGVATIRL